MLLCWFHILACRGTVVWVIWLPQSCGLGLVKPFQAIPSTESYRIIWYLLHLQYIYTDSVSSLGLLEDLWHPLLRFWLANSSISSHRAMRSMDSSASWRQVSLPRSFQRTCCPTDIVFGVTLTWSKFIESLNLPGPLLLLRSFLGVFLRVSTSPSPRSSKDSKTRSRISIERNAKAWRKTGAAMRRGAQRDQCLHQGQVGGPQRDTSAARQSFKDGVFVL